MLSLQELLHLNYMYGSLKYDITPSCLKSRVVRDLIKLPFWFLGHLVMGFQPKRWFPGRGKIVFFFNTHNNYFVLQPVQALVPDSVFLTTSMRYVSILSTARVRLDSYLVQTWLVYLVSFFFVPRMLYYCVTARKEVQTSLRAFFRIYLLTFGLYVVFRLYVRALSPKAVAVANDHMGGPRTLVKICKEMGIPTFFIPHGTIDAEGAAPLEFDFALLEGQDSLEKYQKAGKSSCQVYLVGRPFFDSIYKDQNRSRRLGRLGICPIPLDSFERIELTCRILHESFPEVQIVLRPHPAMVGREFSAMAAKLGIAYSNSRTENSIEFMKRVDAIVSGDSSVLLDAAIANVYPIYYDPDGKRRDVCGFVASGLADYVGNIEGLLDLVRRLARDKPDIRMRTRVYCATTGTRYDGRSSELANDLIQKLVLDKEVLPEGWRRIPDARLEAYEFVE